MTSKLPITSSDPQQLASAIQVANSFANRFIRDDIVGIAFLGAIVRGYFDHSADIDIALFAKGISPTNLCPQYVHEDGFEIHSHVADFDAELATVWDMGKRWAFSESQVYHDPQGLISKLLLEKIPLKPEERKWLQISGITQSEWYINRLTQVWVERGSITSAHTMFNQGLNHFFEALFGLNNQLVADHKWRYYYAERLDVLPRNFKKQMEKVLLANSITIAEIERRRADFMELWRQVVPLIEREVRMPFDEFKNLV